MKQLVIMAVLLTMFTPAAANVHFVTMGDYLFSPDSIDIHTGDSVRWTNSSYYYVHTSTSGVNGTPDGHWDSGDVAVGGTFTHAFTASGRFPYYCTHHYFMGMLGVVMVSASAVDEARNSAPVLTMRSSPNPFRRSTMLHFSPAVSGFARDVSLYDVSGHRVYTASGVRSSLFMDLRSLPAGVYHCVSGRTVLTLTKLD